MYLTKQQQLDNIVKINNFLWSYMGPLDMSSSHNCAAPLISINVFGAEDTDAEDFSEHVDIIEKHTGIDYSILMAIFCDCPERSTAQYYQNEWVYDVNMSEEVTKEMVLLQFSKQYWKKLQEE